MRTRSILATMIGVTGLFVAGSAIACGFKFVGKNGELLIPKSKYPAQIVMFASEEFAKNQADISKVLTAVGHEVIIASPETVSQEKRGASILIATSAQLATLGDSANKFLKVLPAVEDKKGLKQLDGKWNQVLNLSDFAKNQLQTVDSVAKAASSKG